MNPYISQLKKEGKLTKVLKETQWQFTKKPYIISGPCSVESEEMIVFMAKKLKSLGVDALRGGAYKPCTYPITKTIGDNGWKEGLRKIGLHHLKTTQP